MKSMNVAKSLANGPANAGQRPRFRVQEWFAKTTRALGLTIKYPILVASIALLVLSALSRNANAQEVKMASVSTATDLNTKTSVYLPILKLVPKTTSIIFDGAFHIKIDAASMARIGFPNGFPSNLLSPVIVETNFGFVCIVSGSKGDLVIIWPKDLAPEKVSVHAVIGDLGAKPRYDTFQFNEDSSVFAMLTDMGVRIWGPALEGDIDLRKYFTPEELRTAKFSISYNILTVYSGSKILVVNVLDASVALGS